MLKNIGINNMNNVLCFRINFQAFFGSNEISSFVVFDSFTSSISFSDSWIISSFSSLSSSIFPSSFSI